MLNADLVSCAPTPVTSKFFCESTFDAFEPSLQGSQGGVGTGPRLAPRNPVDPPLGLLGCHPPLHEVFDSSLGGVLRGPQSAWHRFGGLLPGFRREADSGCGRHVYGLSGVSVPVDCVCLCSGEPNIHHLVKLLLL